MTPPDPREKANEDWANRILSAFSWTSQSGGEPFQYVVSVLKEVRRHERAEAEARILELLRSESLQCNEPDPVRTGLQWAAWLQERLK